MKSIFNRLKSTVKQEQGMTLVEMLVAMALVMLIIFTFTPLFLQNFKNIRTAGEITRTSYEKVSIIERLIANKGENAAGYEISVSDVPLTMTKKGDSTVDPISFGADTSAGTVNGTIIASNPNTPNSYSTFYTNDTTSRMLCFPSNLTDDFLTTDITVVPKGFAFNSDAESKTASAAGWHFKVSYTDEDGKKQTVGTQYYDIKFKKDGNTNVAVFTIKGGNNVINFEHSPLIIEYGQGVGDLQYSVEVEIGAPEIILVGEQASNGKYYYYVTSGVDSNGHMDLIAKEMTGAPLTSAMNDVEWVEKGDGDDGNGGDNKYGYYVMGGDAGQVRRFWRNEKTGNYYWGGDVLNNYDNYLNESNDKSTTSHETFTKENTTQAMYKTIYRGEANSDYEKGTHNVLFDSDKITIGYKYQAVAFNYFTANVTGTEDYYLTSSGVFKKNNKVGTDYEYYGFHADMQRSEYDAITGWISTKSAVAGSTLNIEGYKKATDYEYADDSSLITITSVGAIKIDKSNSNYYPITGNSQQTKDVYPKQSYTLYCGYIPAVTDIYGWKTANTGGWSKYVHIASLGAAYSSKTNSWYPTGLFGDIKTVSTRLSNDAFSSLKYKDLLNYCDSSTLDRDSRYPYPTLGFWDSSITYYYVPGTTVNGVAVAGQLLAGQGEDYYLTAGNEVDITVGYLSEPFAIGVENPEVPVISGLTGASYYFKDPYGNASYNSTFFSSGLRNNVTMLDVDSFHDDITGNNISVAVGYSLSYLFQDYSWATRLSQAYNTGLVYIRATGDGNNNDTTGSMESGKGWSLKKETNVFHQFYGTDQYQDGSGVETALGWNTNYHRAYFNISYSSSKAPQAGTTPTIIQGVSGFGTNCHPMADTECSSVRWGLTWDSKPQFMWGTKNGSLFSWNYDYETPTNSKITAVTKEFESYTWADRMGITRSVDTALGSVTLKKLRSSNDRAQFYDYTSVKNGTSDTYGFVSVLKDITDIEYADDCWVAVGTQSGKAPEQYCATNNCYSGNGEAASYINVKYCYDEANHLYAWKAVKIDNATNINFISITYSQGMWYLTGYVDKDNDGENDLDEKAVMYYTKNPADAASWKLVRTQRADGSYNSTTATAVYFDASGNKQEIDLTGINAIASQG